MASNREPDARPGERRARVGARERILDAAYALFARHGIRAVGVDRIVAEAGVAKATLYHHFASKQELVIAFLDLREERWTHAWLARELERRAATPQQCLLVVFDVLDDWFRRPDFEGCSFINTLLEIPENDDPRVYRETVRHLGVVQAMLESYAEQAGLRDAKNVSSQLQILMMGAIVAAGRGDRGAARRARAVAEPLIDSSR